MDDSSSEVDEVRREERQGIAGLLREATDQTQLLAEIERLSKHGLKASRLRRLIHLNIYVNSHALM